MWIKTNNELLCLSGLQRVLKYSEDQIEFYSKGLVACIQYNSKIERDSEFERISSLLLNNNSVIPD